MDKQRMIYKSALLAILTNLNQDSDQIKVMEILEKCESQMPDSHIVDLTQKIRRKNKDFYTKADMIVDDIFDKKLDFESFKLINHTINELIPFVKKEQNLNLFEQIIENFKNATGIK